MSDTLVLASIRGGSPSAPKAQPADARGIGGVVELLEQRSLDPDGDAHHLMEVHATIAIVIRRPSEAIT